MAARRMRTARSALGALLVATAIGTATIGALASGPAPVAAATPRTVGEIIVDDAAGHVFVTDGDTVTVHDLDGTLVHTITGQTGARDLVRRGGTLYVRATGAERISAVDTTTLEVTGTWDLDTPLVLSMAWSSGRIWFTYGDQWGAIGSLDPATGTIRRELVTQVWASAELQATEAPARLYALPRGLSPSRLDVYDVSGADPVLLARSAHSSGGCSNGRDLALSADGTTGWTACGAPYVYKQWDLADVSAPTGELAATHYPNGIATTAGGYRVGTLQGTSLNLRLYEPGATTPVKTLTVTGRPAVGMVAGNAGGDRLYVGTQEGFLRTVRLDPVVTAVAPTPVDRNATITVTGTGLADVTTAEIGGVAATITPVSATSLKLTVPASLVNGSYPLLLTSRWGDSADTPATVRVFGPEVPHTPEQPTIVVAGSHSLTVTWPALGADSWPATSYEVTAHGWPQTVATVTGRSATFTGLWAELPQTFSVVAVNAVGRSEPSPSSEPAFVPGPDVAPFPSINAFVTRQHLDLLGRGPVGSETDTWVQALRAGTSGPGDLVAALRGSADHAANVDPVARLYQAYFLRTPDATGLTYWIDRRRTGTSLAQVSQAFAASAEFRTLYGSLGNRAFVQRIYRNVLGREGDATGVAYWTGELDARRRTRGSVMLGFSESAEYRNAQAAEVTTSVLHVLLLGRKPTPGELSTTVARLEGGTTVATVAAEILAGDEYAARISG